LHSKIKRKETIFYWKQCFWNLEFEFSHKVRRLVLFCYSLKNPKKKTAMSACLIPQLIPSASNFSSFVKSNEFVCMLVFPWVLIFNLLTRTWSSIKDISCLEDKDWGIVKNSVTQTELCLISEDAIVVMKWEIGSTFPTFTVLKSISPKNLVAKSAVAISDRLFFAIYVDCSRKGNKYSVGNIDLNFKTQTFTIEPCLDPSLFNKTRMYFELVDTSLYLIQPIDKYEKKFSCSIKRYQNFSRIRVRGCPGLLHFFSCDLGNLSPGEQPLQNSVHPLKLEAQRQHITLPENIQIEKDLLFSYPPELQVEFWTTFAKFVSQLQLVCKSNKRKIIVRPYPSQPHLWELYRDYNQQVCACWNLKTCNLQWFPARKGIKRKNY
jgi:hypothetical protein